MIHYFPEVNVTFGIYTEEEKRGYFKDSFCFTSERKAKKEYKKQLKQAIKMLEKEIKDLDSEVQSD